VKGQVMPNQVVMLGDSYMDLGGVGPAIMAAAGNVTYRTYYLAGSAVNYGTGQGNIPYQYMNMAVPASADIKVVIMDGGGNDILINNQQCLSTAPPDPACKKVVDDAVATVDGMMKMMAMGGVQHIILFTYPDLSTSVGVDAAPWADYSAGITEDKCCGMHFTATATNYSCRGNGPGTDCVIVDPRAAFAGHLNDYFMLDNIHPNAAGAKALAGLVWNTMVADCIAQ
jgi:lysophospholipase L1-like esterase